MINILYLSHSSHRGGAELVLLVLLKHLDRRAFQPLVLLPEEGYLAGEIDKLGIPRLIQPIPWWLRSPGTVHPQSLLGPSWSGEISALDPLELMHLAESALQVRLTGLVELIRQNDIHLVHTNTFPILEGALAARMAGVRHIWHLHEVDEGHPGLLPRLPAAARYRMLDALSDRVVVVSDYSGNFFRPHVAAERLRLIYNGVESEFGHLAPEDPQREDLRRQSRAELGLQPGHLVICSVGHADQVKGWTDLVAAAGLLAPQRDKVRFVVVGDTQRAGFPAVQEQVRRLGLSGKILFTGPRVDAQRIMLASDVVFQPSLWENLAVVAVEAAALSLPVVATRCGGTDEVIHHGENGFLTPIGDHRAMAEALAVLLDDPELRRRFGAAGREIYQEKFTPSQYVANFSELYRDVIRQEKISFPGEAAMLPALASLYAALLGSVMQAEHSRQHLAEIFASPSYRLMEPLRRLRKLFS